MRIPLRSEREKPPEEQTSLLVRVLDFDDYRRVIQAAGNITTHYEHSLETIRKVLGLSLVGVENLKIADDNGEVKEFVLERAGSEITKASMSVLAPWVDEILDSITKAFTFGLTDAKNSR